MALTFYHALEAAAYKQLSLIAPLSSNYFSCASPAPGELHNLGRVT